MKRAKKIEIRTSDLIKLSKSTHKTIDLVETFVKIKKQCSVCKQNDWSYIYIYVGLQEFKWIDQIEFVCDECARGFSELK